jgi:hypothetical protein
MSSKQKKILLPVLTMVSISLGAFVFGHTPHGGAIAVRETYPRQLSDSPVPAVASGETLKAPKAASPLPILGPVQMVRFTVYDEGIRPSEAHVTPGLVAIHLDDKSTHTASLIVANEQHPLVSINREAGRVRGHSTISLTQGRYTIYQANRRANAATIIVAP